MSSAMRSSRRHLPRIWKSRKRADTLPGMNRIFSRVLTLGIAVSAIGAALPACAKNDKSIFIRGALFPPTNRTNGSCVYTVDTQAPGLFYGSLDTKYQQTYVATLLVGNQLIARSDPLDPRAESSRVHLKGVVSRVTDANGNDINELTGNGSSFADAAANGQPGFGIIQVPIIDTNTLSKITLPADGSPVELLTQLRAFGTTLGGEDVESGEFQFVVKVCKSSADALGGDCLEKRSAPAPTPACSAVGTSTASAGSQTAPCIAGQDEPIPCTICQIDPNAPDPNAPANLLCKLTL